MRRRRLGILSCTAAFGLATGASAAQLNVGAGSSLDLGTGNLDLGCADLVVEGTLDAGTGVIDWAEDVSIGGTLNGGSAILYVTGDWNNSSTFNAELSSVRFVDGCDLSSLSATVSGDSSFFDLDMTTSTGKLIAFAAGSTTTVTDYLTLAGAPGNRLQIRSTVDGSEAYLDLQGGQSVTLVEVKDIHAIGNEIEYGPDSSSLGNTDGWVFVGIPVPTLGPVAFALLAALLMTASAFAIRRRVFAG
jgi:hypothetical protein